MKNFNDHECMDIVCLDFQKTCDKVSHVKLVHKLQKTGHCRNRTELHDVGHCKQAYTRMHDIKAMSPQKNNIQSSVHIMTSTEGKVIRCKGAVAWKMGEPLSIEDVEVHPPKEGEVRIKVVANGVCHTDLSAKNGIFIGCVFPVILGHEASGIVESIGIGVTTVVPGDHVVPGFVPQCRSCKACKRPKGNLCETTGVQLTGKMVDGTTRFTCKEQQIHHFLGVSSYIEYSVIAENNICKVPSEAPLEKICLLGCGIGTGYGAAINTAEVTAGSSCAVWGLGGIGLAAIIGCKTAGAARIIGVDVNPRKFELAKKFGATECINPMDHNRPISDVLKDMTDGGLDFTLECIGRLNTVQDALDSCYPSGGTSVIVGCPPQLDRLQFNPLDLQWGRSWKGCFYGGWKTRDDIPKLVDRYMKKEMLLDEFISATKGLDQVNEAFMDMEAGHVIRTVLHIGIQ